MSLIGKQTRDAQQSPSFVVRFWRTSLTTARPLDRAEAVANAASTADFDSAFPIARICPFAGVRRQSSDGTGMALRSFFTLRSVFHLFSRRGPCESAQPRSEDNPLCLGVEIKRSTQASSGVVFCMPSDQARLESRGRSLWSGLELAIVLPISRRSYVERRVSFL